MVISSPKTFIGKFFTRIDLSIVLNVDFTISLVSSIFLRRSSLGTFLRENCNSCHSSETPKTEIKGPHHQRTNCLQCHVMNEDLDF